MNLSVAVASVVDKLAPIEGARPTEPPQPEAFSVCLNPPSALSCAKARTIRARVRSADH